MGKTYRRNDDGSLHLEGRRFSTQQSVGAEQVFDMETLTSKDTARKNKKQRQQFNEDCCFSSDWD